MKKLDSDGELSGDSRRPYKKACAPFAFVKRTFSKIPKYGGKPNLWLPVSLELSLFLRGEVGVEGIL